MNRFRDRALVLSGAASGIGAATARRLAAEGARLLLVDIAPDVAGVAAETGAESMALDLAAGDAPAALADRARALFGTVDGLLNVAGIGGSKRLPETDDALLDRILSVNLRAVFRVTRAVLPLLRRPGGAVVNISSTLGLAGHPGTAAYAAAKGGVAQFTRQLAAEFGPEGLRVNAVAPGVIETPMTAERIHHDPGYRRAFIDAAPVRTWGQPEDIAAAIAFLASDDARFVSGVVLPVDGGWLDARHPPAPD